MTSDAVKTVSLLKNAYFSATISTSMPPPHMNSYRARVYIRALGKLLSGIFIDTVARNRAREVCTQTMFAVK